jgi:phosphinothricin acetyltransferase
MSSALRLATEQDAESISGIYAPVVRDTPISFEWEPPTIAQMQQRIVRTLAALPWLVYEHDGEVLGYVYAGKHSERTAYQWSVDVSVYVHPAARRMGVGRALYTSLFAALIVQGFYNVYAGATLPNPGSVALHEGVGFKRVGVYHAVGYKFGTWYDVVWWERALQAKPTTPPPLPLTLDQVQNTPAWDAALAAGLPLLRHAE